MANCFSHGHFFRIFQSHFVLFMVTFFVLFERSFLFICKKTEKVVWLTECYPGISKYGFQGLHLLFSEEFYPLWCDEKSEKYRPFRPPILWGEE